MQLNHLLFGKYHKFFHGILYKIISVNLNHKNLNNYCSVMNMKIKFLKDLIYHLIVLFIRPKI